jgi:AraC family ethanolamine operon transcriptional activator
MAVNIQRFKQHALAVWGDIPMTGLLKARSPAHREILQEKIRNTLHLFSDHPGRLSDTNSAMVIEEELLDVLLWATKPPPLHLRHAIRHKHAKKAEVYIRDHIDEPISIRSLCESIGVSERALRNGFVECFGLSPKRYMQSLRLHQIRRALKAAHPKETTVTRIAMDWGVSHLGRFSRNYRKVFGEMPSAALKPSQR